MIYYVALGACAAFVVGFTCGWMLCVMVVRAAGHEFDAHRRLDEQRHG